MTLPTNNRALILTAIIAFNIGFGAACLLNGHAETCYPTGASSKVCVR